MKAGEKSEHKANQVRLAGKKRGGKRKTRAFPVCSFEEALAIPQVIGKLYSCGKG